jgi:hypothetical protein
MHFERWFLVVLVLSTACTVPERQVSVASDNGGHAGQDSSSLPRAGSDGSGGRTSLDTMSSSGGTTANADGIGGTTTAPSGIGGAAGNSATQGGSTASGGSIGSGGLTASAGTSSQTCPARCTAETPYCVDGQCVSCTSASGPRCNDNVPEVCQSGKWTKTSPCVGATPICNAGTCGGLRLIGKLNRLPVATGSSVRLVNGQLSSPSRTCSSGVNPICVADVSIAP